MEIIHAPFTEEQVKNLASWQGAGYVHPFTCTGHDGCNRREAFDQGKLIPYKDGWVCPCGKYTQNWAHSFMAEPTPPNPMDDFAIKRMEEIEAIGKTRPLTEKEQKFVKLISEIIVKKTFDDVKQPKPDSEH